MACDTLEDTVKKASAYVADKGLVAWPEGDVTRAISDGLAAISSQRPDLFSGTQEITLKPGSRQLLPEGTLSLVGDIQNVCVAPDGSTTEGSVASAVNRDELRALQYYTERRCDPYEPEALQAAQEAIGNTCAEWVLSSYVYDPRDPTALIVSPAVPAGVEPVIRVGLQGCAPCLKWPESKDAVLPCSYRAELMEYVRYVLLGMQIESESALADSRSHFTNFANMMGIKYRQETRYGSGFFLGQKGTGDESVTRG